MRPRTTVVGSYPAGGLPPEAALERAVRDQLAAGIDLLSDGQVRADMISLFCAHIPGCVRWPDGRWAVTARLGTPPHPITTKDWQQAASLAGGRPVKGILTGPTTLACAVVVAPGAPYTGPGDPRLVADFAALLADEAAALTRAGAAVIQLDEPFYSLGAAIDLQAIRQITKGAEAPWLHVCGDIRPVWSLLNDAPVAVLQIEATRPDRLPRLAAHTGPALCLGVVDSATDAVESVDQIRVRIKNAVATPHWISPDCGLRLRSHGSARAKLQVLVAGASSSMV